MTTISGTDNTRAMGEDAVDTLALEHMRTVAGVAPPRKAGLGLAIQFFLLAALLLVVTLGLTVAVASWRSSQVAERTIQDDLARVPEVWAGYASTQMTSALDQVRSLANEPGTVALFAEQVDLQTRLSFATEDAPQMLLDAQTFFLFDRYSRVLARSDRPDGSGVGQAFAGVGWVASVLDSRQGTTAFIREKQTLAVVAAAPVIAGEGDGAQLLGVLAVTFPVDGEALSQLRGLTRGEVAVVVDMAKRGEDPQLSLSLSTPGIDGEMLTRMVFDQPDTVDRLVGERLVFGPERIQMHGGERVILGVPIESSDGNVFAALLVARSRAEEMASFYAIRRALIIAGAVMLLLSLPISFLLGRRIAGPLRALAAGAEFIRDGRLDVELPTEGSGEVGVLADAFRKMVDELREKEALEQLLVDLKARSSDTGSSTAAEQSASTSVEDLRLPELGESFGTRYKIRSELGRGGMGVVYRATDLELEEDVALKVLKPGAFEDATDGLAKLKREIRLARRISHSNVIRVHDLVEAGGMRCLSMEYVPGTTLLKVLKQTKNLGFAPGLQIAKQMCRGLEAVHREGIVHRDLKPQNIMVLPNGVVKLMDFGISRGETSSGDGEKKMVEGTPAYMSPEQCRGETPDNQSDIYSLGIMLWEMFAGHMPFTGKTVGSMIQQQLTTPPPPMRAARADVPAELETIVMSCLAKDPSRRPASANAVYLGLREVLVTEW